MFSRRSLFRRALGVAVVVPVVVAAKPKPAAAKPAISALPVGLIVEIGGSVPLPVNCVECGGQTLEIADYPELHDVIGTTYGGAPGKFFAPDLRQSYSVMTHRTEPSMSAHSHGVAVPISRHVMVARPIASLTIPQQNASPCAITGYTVRA